MFRRSLLILGSLLTLLACSPALNWRAVSLAGGDLQAMLPCKPDRASRTQSLAGQTVQITMAGCEAGGALFAISYAQLDAPERALAVQTQWQAHLLGNMQASTSSGGTLAIKGAAGQPAPVFLQAQGVGPDGRAVQAQAAWFARGQRLYHGVIYAQRLRPEMSEPFFDGLELR